MFYNHPHAIRLKITLFLPLLAALALCSCVTSRTPVGDKVAALDPKVWNAKWRAGDGEAMRTRIKDARLGIVEVTRLAPWTKPKPGDVDREDLLVRMLGGEIIANEKEAGGFEFERVAIDGSRMVAFEPNEPVFEALINRHEMSGTIDRNKNGQSSGSCTIGGFSERDYKRLVKRGFAVQTLFNEDPAEVFIRDHGIW
jgi:hypothetical protein